MKITKLFRELLQYKSTVVTLICKYNQSSVEITGKVGMLSQSMCAIGEYTIFIQRTGSIFSWAGRRLVYCIENNSICMILPKVATIEINKAKKTMQGKRYPRNRRRA